MSYFKLVVNDFKVVDGCKCFRIQATRNFENAYRNVKKGELGGYVYGSGVLGDNSWVFGNAVLLGNSRLLGSSYIVGDYTFNRFSGQNIQIVANQNMNGHVRLIPLQINSCKNKTTRGGRENRNNTAIKVLLLF